MKRFVAVSPLGELIVAHRGELIEAARRRHARDLRVFGSVARGEDTEASDVDFLVELDPEARPLNLLSLACDAEDILGVRVDVGTVESLRPEVRASALADALAL